MEYFATLNEFHGQIALGFYKAVHSKALAFIFVLAILINLVIILGININRIKYVNEKAKEYEG